MNPRSLSKMIKVIILTVFAGLAAAQYGRSHSGYGPDGVRNRYFILGHGRPVIGSAGSGIYGPSTGPSYSPKPRYSPPAPTYSAPPRPHAPVVSRESSSANPALSSPEIGHLAPSYAPSYIPAAPAPRYVPAAPAPRYAPTAPSYSAPSLNHGLYGPPAASQGYPGSSRYGSHDDLAQPTPYDFGYDVHNEHGDQLSRQEAGDGHGNVKGSYGYRDAYGVFRHVDYVADHAGFRANVRTNEPGTAPQDPADVHMQVEHNSGY